MVEIHPMRIPGRWADGRALDIHTEGLHDIEKPKIESRKVLLFDDLFRSGATMNSITGAMYDYATAQAVFALTLTRTRSKQ